MELNHEIRAYIIELLASHEEPKDIKRLLKDVYGRSYSVGTIRNYKVKFKAEIADRREQLNREIQELPIANLFWRLKQRQDMIDSIKESKYKVGNVHLYNTANTLLDSVANELNQLRAQGWEGTLIGFMRMTEEEFTRHVLTESGHTVESFSKRSGVSLAINSRQDKPAQASSGSADNGAASAQATRNDAAEGGGDPIESRVPSANNHPSTSGNREKDFTISTDVIDIIGLTEGSIFKEEETE